MDNYGKTMENHMKTHRDLGNLGKCRTFKCIQGCRSLVCPACKVTSAFANSKRRSKHWYPKSAASIKAVHLVLFLSSLRPSPSRQRSLVALVESGLKSPCDTWSYSPFCCNVILYYVILCYVCVMNIPTQPRRSILNGALCESVPSHRVTPNISEVFLFFWGSLQVGAACPETGDPKCTGFDPPNSPKWLLVDICPAAQQDIQGLQLASKFPGLWPWDLGCHLGHRNNTY